MPPELERYEPMPGIAELPAWLWRRMRRGQRIAVATAAVLILAGAAVVLPQIQESSRERAAAEERERARNSAARIEATRVAMQPRSGRSTSVAPRGAGAPATIAARTAMIADVKVTLLADVRRRVREGTLDTPATRVTCERFPRTVGGVAPERDVRRRRARLSCLAVTAEQRPGAATGDGVAIGHPYRVLADFETGRFTYCKTTGVTGPEAEQPVTVPVACGGRRAPPGP